MSDGTPASPSSMVFGPPKGVLGAGCGAASGPPSPSSGKIQYGRDFLLQFQPEYTTPPESLKDFHKNFHVSNNTAKPDTQNNPPALSRRIPHEERKGGRGRGRGGTGDSARRASQQPPQFGSNLEGAPQSYNNKQAQQLQRGENAYDVRKVRSATMDEKARIVKSMKGILNRLAPEKYQALVSQMKREEVLTDNDNMKEIIHLVFEKAIQEPRYAEMYAQLCQDLSKAELDVRNTLDRKSSAFRRLLLERCQMEFEHREREIQKPEGWENWKRDEVNEWTIKQRERKTGNIRFVGELFKHSMLTEKIMKIVMCSLLFGQTDVIPQSTYVPPEEDIDILAKLLTTIGKYVDTRSPQGVTKEWVDTCFVRMDRLRVEPSYASRFRFMLMDVMELRDSEWVPRKVEVKVSKMSEVDKHIEEAAQQKQRKAEDAARREQQRGQRNKQQIQQQQQVGSGSGNEWKTVGTGATATPTTAAYTPPSTKGNTTTPQKGPKPQKGVGGSNKQGVNSDSVNTNNTTTTTTSQDTTAKKKKKSSGSEELIPLPSLSSQTIDTIRPNILGCVSEWETTSQDNRTGTALTEILQDINSWEGDLCTNKALLHSLVVAVVTDECCKHSNDRRREACIDLLGALEKQGQQREDGVQLPDYERGISHVLCEGLVTSVQEDVPKYFSRFVSCVRIWFPLEEAFPIINKILFLAYNQLLTTPDLTDELREDLEEQYLTAVWFKLVDSWTVGEDLTDPVLNELHAFAVKTNWPTDVIKRIFKHVLDCNIIPRDVLESWNKKKLTGGDKKKKDKQYQQTAEIAQSAL